MKVTVPPSLSSIVIVTIWSPCALPKFGTNVPDCASVMNFDSASAFWQPENVILMPGPEPSAQVSVQSLSTSYLTCHLIGYCVAAPPETFHELVFSRVVLAPISGSRLLMKIVVGWEVR